MISAPYFKITVTSGPTEAVQDYWFFNQQGVFGEQVHHTVPVAAPFGAFARDEGDSATTSTSRVDLINRWQWRELQHGKLSLDDVIAGRLAPSVRSNRAAKQTAMRLAGLDPAVSFLLHTAAQYVRIGTRESRLASAVLSAGIADFLRRRPESYATDIATQTARQLYLEGRGEGYAHKTIAAMTLVRLINEAKARG